MRLFALGSALLLYAIAFALVRAAPIGETFAGDIGRAIMALGAALPVWTAINGSLYAIRWFRKTH